MYEGCCTAPVRYKEMVDYKTLAQADVLKRYKGRWVPVKRFVCRFFLVPSFVKLVSYQPDLRASLGCNIAVKDMRGVVYLTSAIRWERSTEKELEYYWENIAWRSDDYTTFPFNATGRGWINKKHSRR